MDFVPAIKTCLNKYVTFSGRAARSEMWFFKLFVFLCVTAGMLVDHALTGKNMGPFYTIALFGLFLPDLSAQVRRLHDLGKSGWWFWIALIPLIGFIILMVWYCTKGTAGDNRFGPDPLTGLTG